MPNALTAAAVAALLFTLAAPPALAAPRDFRIHNNVSSPLVAFRVRGGTVEGFKRIAPGKNLVVKLTLPDGTCQAFVQVRTDSGTVEDGAANLCDPKGVVISVGPNRSLRFLPGTGTMLR